ncbi:MAG: lamin tail domain-containing protein [Actinobacteria bacterium]|nr:lamin tail domain-containing protein [Actinomycetota bacterium]
MSQTSVHSGNCYRWKVPAMRTLRTVLISALVSLLLGASALPALAGIRFTKIQYESPGTDTGSNTSLNGEFVVIKNKGAAAKGLRGWKLKDRRNTTEGGNITFTFPRFRLGAGRTVTIHSGRGTNTRTDLYWGRSNYVWGDDSDTAYLYKPSGTLADRCYYLSTTTQTSPPADC